MIRQGYNPDEFHKLIVSAASYTTNIESFSHKICQSPIQDQLQCLTQVHCILVDHSLPIIKKLFVMRFVKDTMLLASLSFYQCVLVKIYQWLLLMSNHLQSRSTELKISEVALFLRGRKDLPTAEISVCKNFINLAEDIIKWMGTYIQEHPYSNIKFKSAFRWLLEQTPYLLSSKVTNLNFFKTEDPNKYHAYYLEKQTGEQQGQKFIAYIKSAIIRAQRGQKQQLLKLFVQTGDSFLISNLIQQFQARFEQIDHNLATKGINLLLLLNELFMVGEVQFCNKVKSQLLPQIVTFILLLKYHKIRHDGCDSSIFFVDKFVRWQRKCQELRLPVNSFEAAFDVLKIDGIVPTSLNRSQTYVSYFHALQLTKNINKQKLPQLNTSQTQVILKVRLCKYIPFEESFYPKKPGNLSKNSMEPNSQENSSVSNKSSGKKIPFLQADSKIPQKNMLKNTSQVKQIHFQHSNLSDRFHHPPEPSTKPLLVSFKKNEDKDKDIFQTFNPTERRGQKQLDIDYIDIIEEHSHSAFNSEQSRQSKQQIKIQAPEEKYNFNSSFDKDIELFQQSNKNSKSRPSNPSDYYPEVKHSANFASQSVVSNKSSQIQKPKTYQVNESVKDSDLIKNLNDYMLPQNDSQVESERRSKISIKPKYEKSSSIRSNHNKRPQYKSNSKEKILVTPREKLTLSRSIKLIHFNETDGKGEQGYLLPSPSVTRPPVQAIKVQRTLIKPKFGFKCQQILSTQKKVQDVVDQNQEMINQISKSESLSLNPSIDSSPISQIPQNFRDLLKVKQTGMKVNDYQYKIKELELKISKMKEKKDKVVKEVLLKNQEINRIKSQMPIPVNVLELQNQALLKAIANPNLKNIDQDFKKIKGHQFWGQIAPLSVPSMKQQLKKKLLYSKCKLLQNQYIQIGMQRRNNQLTFYFTFNQEIDECWIRMDQNSLVLDEAVDVKMHKVTEKKQIKFKTIVTDHRLLDFSYELGILKVDFKVNKKISKSYSVIIPYHLYHQLKFFNPQAKSQFNRSTNWHFCCQSLYSNKFYLEDFLPSGKYHQGEYLTKIQYKEQQFIFFIIIEGDKFKIQYQKHQDKLQLPILKCLVQLFQK